MINHARNIKDLSIALEALARVPKSEDFVSIVESLLLRETTLHKNDLDQQETIEANLRPPQRHTKNLMDDEIPF